MNTTLNLGPAQFRVSLYEESGQIFVEVPDVTVDEGMADIVVSWLREQLASARARRAFLEAVRDRARANQPHETGDEDGEG